MNLKKNIIYYYLLYILPKGDSPTLERVNFCRNCGGQISDGQYVCLSCGFEPLNGHNHCQNCGVETKEGQILCVSCGFKLINVSRASNIKEPSTAPDTGFAILGFFLPIVGLILYLVWQDSQPGKAASAGKGALVGFIVGIVAWVFLSAIFAVII